MNLHDASGHSHEVVIEPRKALARLGIPEVWEHRYLLKYFVLRALRGRYRPTRLGYTWIIARPALLCLAYVLVIGFLFKVDSGGVPFPLFVFLGIALFLFFAGGLTDTMNSLIGSASIISKVYYPRLIVPLTTLLSNFLDLLAALIIVAGMMVFYRIVPNWDIIFLPAYLLAFMATTFSLGLIGAARTVKVRDVLLMMPSLMRVAIYMMPCVYPVTLIPERYLSFYYLNPLAVYVQGVRWSLLGDVAPPTWSIWLATAVVGFLLAYGLVFFNRVERSMVDTL